MEHVGDVNVMPANQQKIVLVLNIFITNIFTVKLYQTNLHMHHVLCKDVTTDKSAKIKEDMF